MKWIPALTFFALSLSQTCIADSKASNLGEYLLESAANDLAHWLPEGSYEGQTIGRNGDVCQVTVERVEFDPGEYQLTMSVTYDFVGIPYVIVMEMPTKLQGKNTYLKRHSNGIQVWHDRISKPGEPASEGLSVEVKPAGKQVAIFGRAVGENSGV